MSSVYKVYFTPLEDLETYGDEIDVSDNIEISGINTVRRGIDSGDYNIGVFAFGDIDLKGINRNGYFNDPSDWRSIFKYSRDLCKVRIEFIDSDATTITFRGLINDEATRYDANNDQVSFRVLSEDSILRKTKIGAGIVENGMLASVAAFEILNQIEVTRVLNVDVSDINLAFDFVIDVASYFDNLSIKEGLDALLLCANSVLLIDSGSNVIIRSRADDPFQAPINLYGRGDIQRRENILGITNYNSGKQRQFTSVKLNSTVRTNDAFVDDFGFRQKVLSFSFLTTPDTIIEVADEILAEFKAPKAECEVEVSTRIAKNLNILDRISINFPNRLKPIEGTFFPVIGVTEIDETMAPLPNEYGSLTIHPNVAWKIIEMREDPSKFTTTLKLRVIGTELNDGVFNAFGNPLIDYAIIDQALIGPGGEIMYNPSVIGAALIAETEVAA